MMRVLSLSGLAHTPSFLSKSHKKVYKMMILVYNYMYFYQRREND